MDRGPEGYESHPPEIWLFLCEAQQGSGADSFVGWPRSSVGRGLVSCHYQPRFTSSLSDGHTGEMHKRQRRAMAPAFGLIESKALLPHFMDAVTKVGELRCI